MMRVRARRPSARTPGQGNVEALVGLPLASGHRAPVADLFRTKLMTTSLKRTPSTEPPAAVAPDGSIDAATKSSEIAACEVDPASKDLRKCALDCQSDA